MLDLIDARLGQLCLGDGDGGGRRGGTERDALHRLTRQVAHKLDGVAVFAAAIDTHIGIATHHAQTAQSQAHSGNQLTLGHVSTDLHLCTVVAMFKAQATDKTSRHSELELSVGLGIKGCLGRQVDALIDVDQEALHFCGQAVNAHRGGAGCCGL